MHRTIGLMVMAGLLACTATAAERAADSAKTTRASPARSQQASLEGLRADVEPIARCRHQGRTYLLGIRHGTVVCTDAATGKIIWKKPDVPLANATVAGDVLAGAMSIAEKDASGPLLHGFRLTLQGIEHLWQADAKEAGYGYYGNFPSTAADGTVLAPRHLAGKGGGDHTFNAMVRLDPQTGKVLAVYPAKGIAHHLALRDLDDGWIWSKIWYRNYLYLRADDRRREGSELPQIPDEGRMFNTAYSYPVNDAYAAGRMVLRGNFYLHGLDCWA